MRKYAVTLVLSCVACGSGSEVAEAGGTSESSSSSTGASETETSGAEGASGTGETSETDETGETGEPEGMECPSSPQLGFAEIFVSLPEGVEGPVACEVMEEAAPNSNVELSCEGGGGPESAVLLFSIGEGMLESVPLQLGQIVEVDYVLDEQGDSGITTIRDPGTQRLLMAGYFGRALPQDLDPPLDSQLFAPLSVSVGDTLCATDCENFQGPGVPPACDCQRKLDLEVSGGAAAMLIRDNSWASIEVPGEGDAFFGVSTAISCEDEGGASGSFFPFRWVYVAAAE